MASVAGILPASEQCAVTSLPPGPGWPALARTLAWVVPLPWVLDRCAERYGEVFTMGGISVASVRRSRCWR